MCVCFWSGQVTVTFNWKGNEEKMKTVVLNRDEQGDLIGHQRNGEVVRITSGMIGEQPLGPKRQRES